MRRVSKLLPLWIVVAVLLAARGHGAVASEWWCWDDPVIVVDGRAIHVLAGVQRESRSSVMLAELVVTVPESLEASLKPVPSPQFPQQVTLERSGSVNADGTFTVTARLTVTAPPGTAAALRIRNGGKDEATITGSAGAPITAALVVPPKPGQSLKNPN